MFYKKKIMKILLLKSLLSRPRKSMVSGLSLKSCKKNIIKKEDLVDAILPKLEKKKKINKIKEMSETELNVLKKMRDWIISANTLNKTQLNLTLNQIYKISNLIQLTLGIDIFDMLKIEDSILSYKNPIIFELLIKKTYYNLIYNSSFGAIKERITKNKMNNLLRALNHMILFRVKKTNKSFEN